MKTVYSLAALRELLGDRYVVFAGSAVSSVGDDALPSVSSASASFFELLSDELVRRQEKDCDLSPWLRVAASYAASLWHGRFRTLRDETKFEDFIGCVSTAQGSTRTSALLRALFLCRDGEFQTNHAAIVALINSGVAQCVTTNFDNSIEVASSGTISPWVFGVDGEAGLAQGQLLKIHGDVTAGRYVADLPALRRADMRFLVPLLAGRNVLFCGYSGTGDVDVAPRLANLAALGGNLIWANPDPGDAPAFATHWLPCNLASADPAVNPLLALAAWAGEPVVPTHSRAPNWRSRLQSWMRSAPTEELVGVVDQILNWEEGWAVLHLRMVRAWAAGGSNSALARLAIADALNQSWVYSSALRFAGDDRLPPEKEMTARRMKAFAFWRLGSFQEALEELRPVLESSSVSDLEREISARHYVEIVRDEIERMTSLAMRQSRWDRRGGDEVLGRLLASEQIDGDAEHLARLVEFHVSYLLGRDDRAALAAELQELYESTDAERQLMTRAAVARLLIQIDWDLGYPRLKDVVRQHIHERRNLPILGKDISAVLRARFPDHPLVPELFDGPPSARVRDFIFEARFRAMLVFWRLRFAIDRQLCRWGWGQRP